MNSLSDLILHDPTYLLSLKIGFGILLGYVLYDLFCENFPPDEPDGFA